MTANTDTRTELAKKNPPVCTRAVLGATHPIQMRVGEQILDVRATLAVKLFGEDRAARLPVKKEVQSKLPGVADLSSDAEKGSPQLISQGPPRGGLAIRHQFR